MTRVILAIILSFYFLLANIQPIWAAEAPFTAGSSSTSRETMLSPDLPIDIPVSLDEETKLLTTNFPALQRLFDIFSWKTFIALNWPLGSDNKPLSNIADSGTPYWLTYHESLQVFRPDGAAPSNEKPRFCANFKNNTELRELYLTSSLFSNSFDKDIADEENQAFTSPLYDQNGKPVRYEVFLNDEEYDYLVENKLYNYDGQIEFSKSHEPVNFPSGDRASGKHGVMELKLAWKVLDPKNDIPSRFYKQTVLLPDVDPDSGEPILTANGNFQKCAKQDVGLVGMHISTKTTSSPQWIWATFEHIDNLNVDDTTTVDGKPLKPLFHDNSTSGQILPVNVPPIRRDSNGKPDPNGALKTQVSRPIPVPKAKQNLNHAMQDILAAENSPLQYYELIDTQWPTAPYPNFPGYAAVAGGPSPSNLPDAITRKSVGAPAPVYLTNSIMETYLQNGNQIAHFQENGFPFNNAPVFGTESCMACHYSAGIANGYVNRKTGDGKTMKTPTFAGDITADFSWLPQLKASFAQSAE
jgi:hypothetical protein